MKPDSALIVDDEQELASLYGQFLSSKGLDVVSFTEPMLALEHYQQNPLKYSIAITDLRMPGMNGLKLANEIRKLDPSVKIFLITAFDITDLKNDINFQSAQINEIIQKPVRLGNLRNIIQGRVHAH